MSQSPQLSNYILPIWSKRNKDSRIQIYTQIVYAPRSICNSLIINISQIKEVKQHMINSNIYKETYKGREFRDSIIHLTKKQTVEFIMGINNSESYYVEVQEKINNKIPPWSELIIIWSSD